MRLNLSVNWGDFWRISDGVQLPLKGEMTYEEGEVFALSHGASVELVHSGSGTKNHKHRFHVVLDGHIVGVLTGFPRKFQDEKQAQFQLDNFLFYTQDWTKCLSRIIEGLGATVESVSEIHLAHDSVSNQSVIEFIENWHFSRAKHHEALGRSGTKRGKFHLHFDSHDHSVKAFDWGSKKSDKRLTCYDKTAYLQDHESKVYISDFHGINGIQGTLEDPVIRVELKLKKKALDKIKDLDWQRFEDPAYLSSIYQFHLKNWFEFVPVTGDKQRSRRERFSLLDFSGFGLCTLDRDRSRPKEHLYADRLTIKSLYRWYYLTQIVDL
ncbi:MAG: hypothetical protein AAFP89_20675 [Bacteroidota bacterium]